MSETISTEALSKAEAPLTKAYEDELINGGLPSDVAPFEPDFKEMSRYHEAQESMRDSFSGRVDKEIEQDAELRRMKMMAEEVARLKASPEASIEQIKEKEDKLQELLVKYGDSSANPIKQDIIDHLINLTESASQTSGEAQPASVKSNQEPVAEELPASEQAGPHEEESSSESKESLRMGAKFKVGQPVKVLRSSGKLDDSGWSVHAIGVDAEGGHLWYTVRNEDSERGDIVKTVLDDDLESYQSMTADKAEGATGDSGEPEVASPVTPQEEESAEVSEPSTPERTAKRSLSEMIDLLKGESSLPDDVKEGLIAAIEGSEDYQREKEMERAYEEALKINEVFDRIIERSRKMDELGERLNELRDQEDEIMEQLNALDAEGQADSDEYERLNASGILPDVEVDGAENESAGLVSRLKNRARRVINRAAQALYMAPVAVGNKLHLSARHEGETDEQYEKRTRKKTVLVGLGILALGAGGFYLASRGHANPTDSIDLSDGNNLTPDNSEMPPLPEPPPTPEAPPVEFGPDAYRVDPGEGWFQTFKDMGIPNEEWGSLLGKVGPQLQEAGWAYWDGAQGNWGISRPGELPQNVLDLISNSR